MTCIVRAGLSADSELAPSRAIAAGAPYRPPPPTPPGRAWDASAEDGPPCHPPGSVGSVGELKLLAGRTKVLDSADDPRPPPPPPPAPARAPTPPSDATGAAVTPAASGANDAGSAAPLNEASGPNNPGGHLRGLAQHRRQLPADLGHLPEHRAELSEHAAELAGHRRGHSLTRS